MPFDARDIARLRNVATRLISPENPDGAKGGGGRATQGTGAYAARDLGLGWKMSPSVIIGSGTTFPMATIDGPGTITHIWLTTHSDHWRTLVLRAYWDQAPEPAVEVPLGDFFTSGWGKFAQVSSSMIAVNPNGGFNSYWPMPFQSGARMTVENLGDADAQLYYAVTYETDVDVGGLGYLHAQFRRENPLPAGNTHLLLDGVTVMATTSALIWPGASTHPAGGARASSRSTSTATTTTRRSAAPAPRTTLAAPGISTFPAGATPNTPRRTLACPR